MANVQLKHKLVATDYPGSGAVSASEGLDASEWNEVHATLVPGLGIEITSDGGSPPTFTFAVTTTSVGGDLLPSTDDAFVVGNQSKRWRAGYFARAVSVGATLSIQAGTIRDTSGQIATDSNFVPTTDNARDFGTNTLRWRNSYFAGTISVGTGLPNISMTTVSGGAVFLDSGVGFGHGSGSAAIRLLGHPDFIPTSDLDNAQLGSATARWTWLFVTNIRASTTLNIFGGNPEVGVVLDAASGTSFGKFAPRQASDIIDLGRPTTPWQHGYFSGTVSVGGAGYFGTIVSGGSGFQTNATTSLVSGIDLTLKPGPSNNVVVSQNNFNPASDNVQNIGGTALRWANAFFGSAIQAGTTISAGSGFQTNATSTTQIILPYPDNTYNLGSLTQRWASGFFGSTISGGNAVLTTITSQTHSPQSDNLSDLGTSSIRWRTVYTSTQVSADGSVPLVFGAQNSTIVHNGASGSVAWQNGPNSYFQFQRNSGSRLATFDAGEGSSLAIYNPATYLFTAYQDLTGTNVGFRISNTGVASAGGGYSTNTSVGMAFGGAAVSGPPLGSIVNAVPVMINGAVRLIPVYNF